MRNHHAIECFCGTTMGLERPYQHGGTCVLRRKSTDKPPHRVMCELAPIRQGKGNGCLKKGKRTTSQGEGLSMQRNLRIGFRNLPRYGVPALLLLLTQGGLPGA